MDNSKEKQLRIFQKDNVWHCELWEESSALRNDGYYFEDSVKADNFTDLLIEIGNKKWIDLLNKK